MHNTGDRKAIRDAEKRAKTTEKLRGEFVRWMMENTSGRAYAYDTLDRCHVFSTSFDRDPIMMAFREGERNSGLQLLTDIMTYCPDQYITMQREANERHNSNNRDSDDPTDRTGYARERSSAPLDGWNDSGSTGDYEAGYGNEGGGDD